MNAAAPVALFRCDASSKIGGGHAMRCLTLAEALEGEGWHSIFAFRTGSAATVPALAWHDHIALAPEDGDAPDAAACAARGPVDLAVVDHYGLDAGFEARCRAFARRIAAIDDLADRPHDCDVLLDQTLGRVEADYAGKVPPACRLLLGCDYALLRPDFANTRTAALARRTGAPGRRVLLSFGASDPNGYAAAVADAIVRLDSALSVDVVADPAGHDACRAVAQAWPGRVTVHLRVADMHRLMAAADIAVGAGGTTSWERCALGLPSIVVITADNQRLIARRLAQAGAATVVGDWRNADAAAIARAAVDLAADGPRLAAMAAAAAALVDGKGARRVARILS
jgi:UDP-2,4-diacetamido-2,4,6-trideoxy-beta-L-altropyranose hydrolase